MTDAEWAGIKHFTPGEFDSPDLPGSGKGMRAEFIAALELMRVHYGRPMIVASGFRTPAHNATLDGSVTDSAHMNGWAADIVCRSSGDRFDLVHGALYQRIHRIGIGKTFVHLDMDPTKPQGVLWLYS